MGSERKMWPILLALGAAAVVAIGALNLPGNGWDLVNKPSEKFTPGPVGVVAWVAAVIAVISFGVVGVAHAMVKSKHETWSKEQAEEPEPTPAEKRADFLTSDLKYQEFEPFEVRLRDGTVKNVRLFALPEREATKGIVTRDVVLLNHDGTESGLTYSLLFDDYAWKKGSTVLFGGPGRKGIPIDEAMQDEYLRVGVQKSAHVVCIGLASSEISTMTDQENERLSDARGINLCKALFKLGYIVEGTHTASSASGGYAKSPGAVADPERQRTAIVIAIRYTKEFDLEPFILAINQLVSIVNLEAYSRAPNDFVICDPVLPGPYYSIGDVKYFTRTSDVIVRNIPKPAGEPDVCGGD
jgi:hypothetical protein